MKLLLLASVLLLGAASNGGGCGYDPNHVGIQDYGSVVGRVIDAKTQTPIGNAILSVGSTVTANTGAHGEFTLQRVPIGTQDVVATAGGYETASVKAVVVKDQTTQLDYIKLTPVQ
ncbi:MAG: carboxypeptidase-like regulatory domain-containing protein [Candidatus Eremiobacteraeota bacterium]|nr:carboxypeptidase-like regulatory domain-containing protein [Candidatus Eremiobacteraeota bacterium]